MITVPPRPRLRVSFFYQNGDLMAELVLMDENRQLVTRTMQAVPSPHPLETIQRALLVLIAPPAAPELEPAAELEQVSTEEREAAREWQLTRPPPEAPPALELEPEPEAPLELEQVSTEEREAARAAALSRPAPESLVITAQDVADVSSVLELAGEETEEEAAAARLQHAGARLVVDNSEPEPPSTQREPAE